MTKHPGEIVARVVEECAVSLQSPPISLDRTQAQQMAERLAQEAYERCLRISPDMYREGGGDEILRSETHEAEIHADLQKRRLEGVTDEDIAWWWNMCSFERQMLLLGDEQNRLAMYLFLTRDKGYDEETAAAKIWKLHPKFGYQDDGAGEDRPLPFELKRRIWAYIEKHLGSPVLLQQKMDSATSFNAIIRKEIGDGNC